MQKSQLVFLQFLHMKKEEIHSRYSTNQHRSISFLIFGVSFDAGSQYRLLFAIGEDLDRYVQYVGLNCFQSRQNLRPASAWFYLGAN